MSEVISNRDLPSYLGVILKSLLGAARFNEFLYLWDTNNTLLAIPIGEVSVWEQRFNSDGNSIGTVALDTVATQINRAIDTPSTQLTVKQDPLSEVRIMVCITTATEGRERTVYKLTIHGGKQIKVS